MLRLPLFLLFSLALMSCATAPRQPQNVLPGDYRYAKEYLAWYIGKEMRSEDVTGLSIAVVDDQHLVWAEGFGYSDLEKKIPATASTTYQLGSISKLFTATAVMQLAERERIDIDQPLQNYLPEFSVKSRFIADAPITPRNLLTHHAGLPANLLKGMSVREPEHFTRVVDALHNEYVAYPPNKLFDYSNVGYTLAGAMVERVSGEEFVTYMDRHLLGPLGMTRSSFSQRASAKSYNNNREIPVLPLRDVPSAGLNSNVIDMGRFMSMVFAGGAAHGGQVVTPASLAEMLRPQNDGVPLDLDFKMGLGWMLSGINVRNGGIVANHGGTTLNFQSMLMVLPEQKLGVIVMSNTASSHMMVNRVATKALQSFLEAKSGIRQPVQQKPEFDPEPLSPELIQAYSGYYDTMAGLVKVSGDGSVLNAEALGKQFRLERRKDGMFSIKYKLFGFIPIYIDSLSDIGFHLVDIEGRQILAGNISGEAILFGEKLSPPVAPSREMLSYVGEYEFVDDLAGTMPPHLSINYEDGRLIGEFELKEMPGFLFRIALRPVSQDEVVVEGVGGGRGETARLFRIGNERRIRYSGLDVRRKGDSRSSDVAAVEPRDERPATTAGAM